jgi:hypothetical protein
MTLREEALLLTAASKAYSYGVKIRQLALRLDMPAADLLHEDWRASYGALCDALGCDAVDPLVRES